VVELCDEELLLLLDGCEKFAREIVVVVVWL
jgi:hypothetical protein